MKWSGAGRSGSGSPERWGSVAESLDRHARLLERGRPAADVRCVRGRAVSFGVGVPADAPLLRRARAEGIATLPRSSGGSGLLHEEGDLLWAIVLPRADPRVGRDYARAYARLGSGLVRALATAGLSAAWGAPPARSEEYCTLSSRGEVLRLGGRVVGGAAQHATAQTLLHHGTVSYRVDRALVGRLLDADVPGLTDALGGVAELGWTEGPEALAARLEQALGEERPA